MQLFGSHQNMDDFQLFKNTERSETQQGVHNLEAVKLLEADLKGCLEGLAMTLFGKGMIALFLYPNYVLCFASEV